MEFDAQSRSRLGDSDRRAAGVPLDGAARSLAVREFMHKTCSFFMEKRVEIGVTSSMFHMNCIRKYSPHTSSSEHLTLSILVFIFCANSPTAWSRILMPAGATEVMADHDNNATTPDQLARNNFIQHHTSPSIYTRACIQ